MNFGAKAFGLGLRTHQSTALRYSCTYHGSASVFACVAAEVHDIHVDEAKHAYCVIFCGTRGSTTGPNYYSTSRE